MWQLIAHVSNFCAKALPTHHVENDVIIPTGIVLLTDITARIIDHLERCAKLRQHAEENGELPALFALQQWQCSRLIASHHTMWEDKRFRPAMQFFVDELYGPQDFSQRDADVARVVPKLAKVLPDKALRSLQQALGLNALSLDLDLRMARVLGNAPLDSDSYVKAYKAVGDKLARQQQLDDIEGLGDALADVVHIRGISTLITLARRPAKLAGLLSLHEFLENGYRAFKQLGHVEDFIQPLVLHERELMHALFTQTENPLPSGI